MPLLVVEDLAVTLGRRPILSGISFTIAAGSTFALVGESGSGKTMTALSVMRLLPPGAATAGRILFDGVDLATASEPAMARLRGQALGMVFQEPMTALNPLQTIGAQVAETVTAHHRASRSDAWLIAREALERVGLTAARVPPERYPHELSGGERQRVVVAIATVLKPSLIIADEPTSALDVTSQAVVLSLLRRLVDEDGSSLLLISHDLAAVAALADSLAVMRLGQIVEAGEAPGIFRSLSAPYSRALLAAATYRPAPRTRTPAAAPGPPLLAVDNVVREYRSGGIFGGKPHRVLDGVSFTIGAGENVALVGESGNGKSTLARVILGLDPPQGGRVAIRGVEYRTASAATLRDLRRSVQAVFQDPYGSFDPRMRVARSLAEPLALDPAAAADPRVARKRVDEMLLAVGLSPADGDKYPHQFSGGERQRLAIARALVSRPALLVLDEPVSALDVSIRSEILDLLGKVGQRFGVSYLFISHDLAVVRAIADRVLVLQAGKIVEEGATEQVFARPRHPYTAMLVAAVPDLQRTIAARLR